MKKIFKLLLCLMMTMLLFVGCKDDEGNNDSANDSNKSNDTEKNVTMDIKATADALIEGVTFVDDMSEISSDDFFVAVFTINAEDFVAQKTYMSTGATAELVSAVECKDASSAKTVKAAFEAYTKDLSSQYAEYKPEECTKLDNPVLMVYDKYVIICASDDNDGAKKIIEGQVK